MELFSIRIQRTFQLVSTLKEEGIFIRDGKSRDSAGVLNTTNTFIEKN